MIIKRGNFFLKILIVFVVAFAYLGITNVFAAIGTTQFGGDIVKIDKTTTEISNLEKTGYTCEIPGTVIEIKEKQKKGLFKKIFSKPKIYLIPHGVKSSTKVAQTKLNQDVMLKSSGQGTVTCTRIDPPDVRILTYPKVVFYGNSEI